MRRDPRVPLADIDRAGAEIERFTEGMNGDAYAADARTQSAVERKFEIIGEALNRLHGDFPELAARIPQMRRIVDFRNLLAHGYDHVAPARVWTYAKHYLPRLRRTVQTLLAELGRPDA